MQFNPTEHSGYIDQYPSLLEYYYTLNIFREPPDRKFRSGRDPRAQATIFRIITDFFATAAPETVLLYTCDNSDDGQEARSRLFKTWHNEHCRTAGNGIIKTEIPVALRNEYAEVVGERYIGMITQSHNPQIKTIIEEFDVFASSLASEDK